MKKLISKKHLLAHLQKEVQKKVTLVMVQLSINQRKLKCVHIYQKKVDVIYISRRNVVMLIIQLNLI
jgi:hypothetical protein